MVSLRKLLLVLAVIGITAGIASADCTVTVPTVPIVRAEGLTEQVGAISVACTGVTAGTVDIKLTSTTAAAFTNSLTDKNGTTTAFAGTTSKDTSGTPGVQASASELDFNGLDPTKPIWLLNVRVNANALGLTGGNVTMSVTASGVSGGQAIAVTTSPSSVSVAQSQPGLSLKVSTAGNAFQCNATAAAAQLVFTPGFKGAFRAPGTTGATILGEPLDGAAPTPVVQLVAIFSNIPANTVLTVPNTIYSKGGNMATLVSPKTASGSGTTDITVSGTTQTVAWQVASIFSTDTSGEPFDTAVVLGDTTKTGPGVTAKAAESSTIALGTIAVRGNLGPISTATGPLPVADKNNVVPRFVDTNAATSPVISVLPCATTLLFPYVTTADGFETGVAITNNTLDVKTPQGNYIFGSNGDLTKPLSPQTGTCTMNFFPSTQGTTAPAAQTSVSIPAGNQSVFLVSSGSVQSDAGIKGVGTGFSGYILAQCNFLHAQGFAFGTSGVGGFGYTAADVTSPTTPAK